MPDGLFDLPQLLFRVLRTIDAGQYLKSLLIFLLQGEPSRTFRNKQNEDEEKHRRDTLTAKHRPPNFILNDPRKQLGFVGSRGQLQEGGVGKIGQKDTDRNRQLIQGHQTASNVRW